MLHLITTLLGYTKLFGYYVIVGSSLMGEALFGLLSSITTSITAHLPDLFAALQIVCEDFGVFVGDLFAKIHFALCLLNQLLSSVINLLYFAATPIIKLITSCYDLLNDTFCWFTHTYQDATACILWLSMGVKKFLILFGSGVWFAICLIPMAIGSLIIVLVYYMQVLCGEIQTLLNISTKKMFYGITAMHSYLFDVPLEAICGLLCVGVILLVVHKQSKRIWKLTNKCYVCFKDVIVMTVKKYSYKLKSLYDPVQRPVRGSKDSDSELLLCVVCQTAHKNIVLLPCRHLCVCETCLREIKKTTFKCPMCREHIRNAVNVYI